ncbi:MAG: DEAD/DEAH box helicase [Mariniblastus sp.]
MSHDITASSTSVDTQTNDDKNSKSDARVPVEVVIEGQSSDTSTPTKMVVETTVTETEVVEKSIEPVDIEPSQEIAMLLGETPKSAKAAVQAELLTQAPTSEVSSAEVAKTKQVFAPDVATPAKPIVAKVKAAEVKAAAKPVETKSAETKLASTETVASKNAEPAVASPEIAASPSANPFEEMGLSPGVLKAIQSAGYETPSPIQSETVPHILSGRDLIGQAETGSGKTAAFAWPLLSKIDVKLARPQILVLAPTRELAIQVTAAFEKYASGMKGFRAVTIYGGQSYETQLRAIQRGVHVVVGTPGRMMDHLRRKTLNLDTLKTIVLDEADEMLRMGFIDDVEWILEQIPEERQILSFSATMPPPIQRIARRHLNNPAHVEIKSTSSTADSIEQSCMFVQPREKMERLARLIETEETDGVIVFVKTKNTTIVVAENLRQRGIISSALNGDIPQNQRERTVNQLKSGRINVVVATDVAARGLDVQRISHVINYDFPHDTEAYVHRVGRTGRAGRKGAAVLFVEPKEKGKLGRLQRDTNQRIEQFKQKSIDEINGLRIEKFKEKITAAIEDDQIKFFTKLISDFQSESDLPFGEIAGALAVLAQGETPLLLKELTTPRSNWRDKNDRGSDRGSKGGRNDRGAMTTYRVEVGRSHGVGPGNIVGAVTNEGNLNNADIGRINIFDQFSTIDLPSDLTPDVLDLLQNVNVMGNRLGLTKSDRTYAKSGGRRSGPSHGGGGGRYEKKKFGDKKYGGRQGDKKYGSKSYGDKKYADKQGDKPWASKKREGASSEGRSSGGASFDRSSKPSYDRSSKPAGSSDRSSKPSHSTYVRSGSKPSGSTAQTSKPSSSYDRSSKPTSSSDRSSKPGGYVSKNPKFGTDESKKFSVKRKPKTKAAEKAKNSRKAGAKPSSPMKKYVKIRSAK